MIPRQTAEGRIVVELFEDMESGFGDFDSRPPEEALRTGRTQTFIPIAYKHPSDRKPGRRPRDLDDVCVDL
jgi:hypothetical protein